MRRKVIMRYIALFILLMGCSSSGYNRHYIVSDTFDEAVATQEAKKEE